MIVYIAAYLIDNSELQLSL